MAASADTPGASTSMRGTVYGPLAMARSAGHDLEPGTMVGEYRVEHKLGQGGMGTVYAALHPLIGKRAAIKVMSAALCTDERAIEQFVQEARSVNQIGHPNIVDVFSFGRLPDGRSYFVMEWLQGETLAATLDSCRLTIGEVVPILFQVCDALEAAHEAGIVHRDLKPDNVFLVLDRGNRVRVKLLDFGIAKLLGDGPVEKEEGLLGTPSYISPEQARGGNIDPFCDVYSLGVVAFQMVTGELPFHAGSPLEMVRQHLSVEPPAPHDLWPEIPPSLDGLLVQMLRKDPLERPTLAEVRYCLAELRDTVLQTSKLRRTGERDRPITAEREIAPVGMELPDLEPEAPPPRPSGAYPTAEPPRPRYTPGTTAVEAHHPHLPPEPEESLPDPEPAKSHGLGILAGIGICLVAGVGGGLYFMRGEHAAETPVAPATTAAPSVPGALFVKVNVAAQIVLDGQLVADGSSSARITVARDGEHELVVRAAGRRTLRRKVTTGPGQPTEIEVRLERGRR